MNEVFRRGDAVLLQARVPPHLVRAAYEETKGELVARPEIVVYGKPAHQNRDLAFFSTLASLAGYPYSGYLAPSRPVGPALQALLEHVSAVCGTTFNGILVNRYRDGNDHIGKHADSERSLVRGAPIATVSYGAARIFRIRAGGQIVYDHTTLSNELLVMGGSFQADLTHEIPVQKRVLHERVSFTFRQHQ